MKTKEIFVPEIKFWESPEEIGKAVAEFLKLHEGKVTELHIVSQKVTEAKIEE